MLERLARFSHRHPRKIVVAAVLFFLASGALAASALDVLKPFGFEDPASESVTVREDLARAGGYEPSPGIIALVRPGGGVRSAKGRRATRAAARILRRDRGLGRVITAFDLPGRRSKAMVSKDGKATYILAHYRDGISDQEKDDSAGRLKDALAGKATVGGPGAANNEVADVVEEDVQRAELVAIPVSFLLLLLFFRSFVAAQLPLVTGGLAIVGTIAALRVAAEVGDLSVFAINLVTGVGLGLAIDYSLFVVSRYREELRAHGAGLEALRTTLCTAGRTVVFSSLTVATAMAALLIFPQRYLFSMAIGGAIVSLLAGLVAVTVLPAILALLGNRLMPKAGGGEAGEREGGFWYRLSRTVARQPGRIAVVSAIVMIVAGLPFLRAEYAFPDAQVLPEKTGARQVGDALSSEFGASRTSPIVVAVTDRRAESGLTAARVARVRKRLLRLRGVGAVSEPRRLARGTAQIDVHARSAEYSSRAQDVVGRIRDLPPGGLTVGVAGPTAEFVDQQASLEDHLPTALAIIAITTLVLIFLMTGSVVLPVKALVMNLLTVSVAFGVLVLVFQDGRFESLLDYKSPGGLDNANAILIFALIFTLSTDYGIFLLGRIKEIRDGGASDGEAVALGLARTGRLITAAALILAVAIGAFLSSSVIFVKEFALGALVGIIVDATIVRGLLVPALMQLLGRWNWWAPAPLRAVHTRLGFSEKGAVAEGGGPSA